jgi:hypothetical protein
VVVNKVHRDFLAVNGAAAGQHPACDSAEDLRAELERFLDGDQELASRVYENFERYQALAARDRQNLASLTQRLDDDCIVCVPYFDEDVHDIEGLAQVNAYLFGSTAERREILEKSGV